MSNLMSLDGSTGDPCLDILLRRDSVGWSGGEGKPGSIAAVKNVQQDGDNGEEKEDEIDDYFLKADKVLKAMQVQCVQSFACRFTMQMN